jgi:hypothetical protein
MGGRKRGSNGAGVPARETPGSLQSAGPRAAAPIIKARTAEGGGSTKTYYTEGLNSKELCCFVDGLKGKRGTI